MRRMKRAALSLLLLFLLAAPAGCGGETEPEQDPPPTAGKELTFPIIVSAEVPENLAGVQERLNEYIRERLDLSVRFVPVNIDTLEDFYLLQKSSADTTDFICLLPAGSQLSAMVEAGLVLPLDGLLEQYGPGVLRAAEDVLAAGQLGGMQYMIPEVKDVYTMGTSIEFNAALVKKYGFDITGVRTAADIEPMLAAVAAGEPDVIPLTTYDTIGYTQPLGGYDNLGDSLGVLDLRGDGSLTVVDWYETENFLSLARQMRNWYLKGYLYRDAVVSQIMGTQLVQEGRAFCSLGTIMPTGDQGTDLDNPSGMVEVQLADQPQLLTSYYAGLEGVCVSSSCKHPEKAVQFLELLYTDPYVVNLLEYGIEGENYTLTPDGLADNGGSYFLLYGQPVNQTLRHINREAGADYPAKCAAFSANDVTSPAFGFVFDSAPVAREAALCRAVVDEYFPVIDCGCVDPDTEIPKFIAALKEAGIDAIVAEKQRQLNEWVQRQE